MLFLSIDCARELERATVDLKERLTIRYLLYNGLAPGELSRGRLEHLDAAEHVLFMPRRHWKRNCICNIDAETISLQAVYSEGRRKGPLLVSGKGGHFTPGGIYKVVNRVAARTDISDKNRISPIVLKRTFAREWLRPRLVKSILCPRCGHQIDVDFQVVVGSLGSLQKQFSHKHLKNTAHYTRFVLEDVEPDHLRLMQKFMGKQELQEVTVKHVD